MLIRFSFNLPVFLHTFHTDVATNLKRNVEIMAGVAVMVMAMDMATLEMEKMMVRVICEDIHSLLHITIYTAHATYKVQPQGPRDIPELKNMGKLLLHFKQIHSAHKQVNV